MVSQTATGKGAARIAVDLAHKVYRATDLRVSMDPHLDSVVVVGKVGLAPLAGGPDNFRVVIPGMAMWCNNWRRLKRRVRKSPGRYVEFLNG